MILTVRKTIVGCARCHGEGHEDLEFEELMHPVKVYAGVKIGLVDATHWAACPTNGQPILMSFFKP